MDSGSEKHLQRIKDKFTSLVDAKYRKGAKEHGGRLYEKEGILDMLIEEILDALVYVLTLKEQQNESAIERTVSDPCTVIDAKIEYKEKRKKRHVKIQEGFTKMIPLKCLNCHEEVKALFCGLCSLCYCSLNPGLFSQYAGG